YVSVYGPMRAVSPLSSATGSLALSRRSPTWVPDELPRSVTIAYIPSIRTSACRREIDGCDKTNPLSGRRPIVSGFAVSESTCTTLPSIVTVRTPVLTPGGVATSGTPMGGVATASRFRDMMDVGADQPVGRQDEARCRLGRRGASALVAYR